MTAKNRIVAIRLSNRLERNPELAKELGIIVVNGKAEGEKEHVHDNRVNDSTNKEGETYEYKSREVYNRNGRI